MHEASSRDPTDVCLLQQRYNVDPESLLGAGTVSLEEEEDPLINHNTVSS